MTNEDLAQGYLEKVRLRLKVLALLRAEGGHSDVVREAQELVELALKGMLRTIGVEPPKVHDVGELLLEHRARFSEAVGAGLDRAAAISGWLRHHRERAFYGDVGFIPTKEYSMEHSARAYEDAAWIVALAEAVIAKSRA